MVKLKSWRMFYGRHHDYSLRNICVINDILRLIVVIRMWSFPHSWRITGFVTIITRGVPHAKQERRTFPEHMCSPSVVKGFLLLYIVFCVVFCWSLFVLLLFAIVLSILLLFTASNWYLKAFLITQYLHLEWINYWKINTFSKCRCIKHAYSVGDLNTLHEIFLHYFN